MPEERWRKRGFERILYNLRERHRIEAFQILGYYSRLIEIILKNGDINY